MSPVFESGQPKSQIELQEASGTVHLGGLGVQRSIGTDFPDGGHSESEVREIIVGHSTAKHLLLDCFTEPAVDHIRIISARRATKTEQRDYEEHLKV